MIRVPITLMPMLFFGLGCGDAGFTSLPGEPQQTPMPVSRIDDASTRALAAMRAASPVADPLLPLAGRHGLSPRHDHVINFTLESTGGGVGLKPAGNQLIWSNW